MRTRSWTVPALRSCTLFKSFSRRIARREHTDSPAQSVVHIVRSLWHPCVRNTHIFSSTKCVRSTDHAELPVLWRSACVPFHEFHRLFLIEGLLLMHGRIKPAGKRFSTLLRRSSLIQRATPTLKTLYDLGLPSRPAQCIFDVFRRSQFGRTYLFNNKWSSYQKHGSSVIGIMGTDGALFHHSVRSVSPQLVLFAAFLTLIYCQHSFAPSSPAPK